MVAKTTVRNYTDTELHGSLIFAKELTDFPEAPRRNEQVLINGVLWIFTMVSGSLTWFPLNNQKNAYTHTQGLPSDSWNVQHGMGTQDFLIGVYGADGNLMYPASVTSVTNDSFTVTFTEPVTGRVVAFFNTALFAPSVTAESIVADSLNIGGGAVTADSSGLLVSGNQVVALNSSNQLDLGLLSGSFTPFKPAHGASSAVAAYVGPSGSIVVNTDTKTIHVYDGVAAGGFALSKVGHAHASNEVATWLGYTPAALGVDGKVLPSQMPAIAITDSFPVSSQAAMLALTAEKGDVAVRTDIETSFILQGTDPSVLANWLELLSPGGGVTSVNGKAGPAVTLTTADISEGSNKYYLDSRARAAISLTAGSSGATYNSSTGVLDLSALEVGGTPGGSTTQVQFNNAGAFAGSASLTFNSGTGALSATTFSGAHTGSGAGLTGLTATNITGVIPVANLGSGTASASTFLSGDGSFKAVVSSSLVASSNATVSPSVSAVSAGYNGTSAFVALVNSASGTNEKTWSMFNDPTTGSLIIKAQQDSSSAGSIAMTFARTGTTVTNIALTANSVNLAGLSTGLQLNGAAGSAGQVLTSQGNAAAPTWSAIPSPSTLLATGSLPLTSASNNVAVGSYGSGGIIAFSSTGAGTDLKFVTMSNDTGGNFFIKMPSDSGGGGGTALQIARSGTGVGMATFGGGVTATSFTGVGTALTALSAANISGIIPAANLGTGTANNTTYLRGDGTYAVPTATLTSMIASAGVTRSSGTTAVYVGTTASGSIGPAIGFAHASAGANVKYNQLFVDNGGAINWILTDDAISGNAAWLRVTRLLNVADTITLTGTTINLTGAVVGTSFTGTHTGNGAGLTNLAAANISGVIAPANLGTGTANSSTFLSGDGTYKAASAAITSIIASGAVSPATGTNAIAIGLGADTVPRMWMINGGADAGSHAAAWQTSGASGNVSLNFYADNLTTNSAIISITRNSGANTASAIALTGTAITLTGATTTNSVNVSSATAPANGIYLVAANTLALATNSGEAIRINSSNAVGFAGANYGTAGQILQSNGAAAAPTWVTATGPTSLSATGTSSFTRTTSGIYAGLVGGPPNFVMVNGSATTDQKVWATFVDNSGTWVVQPQADASGSGTQLFGVTRTGTIANVWTANAGSFVFNGQSTGASNAGNSSSINAAPGGSTTGNGGSFTINAGDSPTAGAGGAVTINGGDANAGAGGSITILAGAAGSAASNNGGNVTITAGLTNSTTGTAGNMTLSSGSSNTTAGNSGTVTLQTGSAGTTTGASGVLNIKTGTTINGATGAINIATGAPGSSGGNSGLVLIQSGDPSGSGTSGTVTLRSGNALSSAATGAITIASGLTSGTAGTVSLRVNGTSGLGLTVSAVGDIIATANGTQNLGGTTTTNHFKNGYFSASVFSAGTALTSDERFKQDIEELEEAELHVAAKIKKLVRKYRKIDEVKAGASKIRIGVIAQEVVQAFADEGLDAHDYAVLELVDVWVLNGELVSEGTEGAVADNRYYVNYNELLMFALAAS